MTTPRTVGAVLAAAVAGLALLSCCGTSAADYHRSLDAACKDATAYNRSLPAKMQKQNLSAREMSRIARKYGEKYVDRVDEMDHPGNLDDAHDRLVRTLRSGLEHPVSTPDAALAYQRRIVAAYRAVGASGCVASAQATLKQLQSNLD